MINLLVFLLKANVVFTMLFAVYLLLREEKFLVGNRFILAAILLAAVILPLGPDVFLSGIKSNAVLKAEIPRFHSLFELKKEITSMHQNRIKNGEFLSIGMALYGIVAFLLFGRLMLQVRRILSVVNNSSKENRNGITYCEPINALPPFSFFKYIVVRRNALPPEQYENIIAHETCHCQQLHSFDVLLSELGCILFWANPLIYVYRRQVKLNLEFIADQQALQSGIDCRTYQLNLVSIAIKKPSFQLTNAFHSSKIRKRISMMNTHLPHSSKWYKYAALLPLIAVLYILVNSEQPKSFIRTQIFIDARTNIARFTERPAKDDVDREFKGIYVVDGQIFTDQQIRDLLRTKGQLEFTFSSPPVLGFFTPNDKDAIQKWGKDAKKGAIFLEAQRNISSGNL